MGQGRAILSAAAGERVAHLVFSSVAGADQDSGVPHFESKARIETELADGDVPYTILGPTYFFDNALGGTERVLGGVLDLPLPPDRPLQQLARADLGAFAAQVLLDPAPYVGQRIELASDAPTPAGMAAALGSVLGREVRHEQVPLASIGNPDIAAHPEIGWTRFADWAAHHTWPTAG